MWLTVVALIVIGITLLPSRKKEAKKINRDPHGTEIKFISPFDNTKHYFHVPGIFILQYLYLIRVIYAGIGIVGRSKNNIPTKIEEVKKFWSELNQLMSC